MERYYFLADDRLNQLLLQLQGEGYNCLGPQLQDGVISFLPLQDVGQLPRGWGVDQGPAHYHAVRQQHSRYFAWSNGPQAIKPLTFQPRELLWESRRDASGGLAFSTPQLDQGPIALFGIRACDLAALQLQDEHFLRGREADPAYQARRKGLFLINVNCSHPSDSCFCVSTGDGPSAETGFDLSIDELDDGFVIRAGTPAGERLLIKLALPKADEARLKQARVQHAAAVRYQQRRLPGCDIHGRLLERLEHPHWQAIAQRCLACGNCTAVCPTCFCHSEFDEGGLELDSSSHYRQWDSCFTSGHSYIHGIVIRSDTATRYRQWLGHKLGYWHEQYGRSGCVGCGRCISWCPAGIDFTAEAQTLCEGEP